MRSMNAKLIGFFSGFPTRHFTDSIAEVLREELTVRESLVFISTWPDDYKQNDVDSDGMHTMFAERNMAFTKHNVIDNRTEAEEAVKLIREASCIFLMGGNATLQFDLMCRKGILDEIRQSRAVILGVSAGSMNMGKHVVDIYESLTPYEGLGFADLTIKAHYPLEEDLLQAVKQVSMELPVCLMTDESAIFIKKDSINQIGKVYRMVEGEISPLTHEQLEQMSKTITIKPLTSELNGDYLDFFDNRAFTDDNPNGPCYCTSPNQDEESIKQMVSEFKVFGVKDTVRKYAVEMLNENRIHGYLAYDGELSVGWCNAADMESYVGFVPKFARENACGKTISIVCFEIAPEYRGMGIATAFIDRVCSDAKSKGYVAVEGFAKYSEKRNNFDYQGPARLYEKAGFVEVARENGQVVMRKVL